MPLHLKARDGDHRTDFTDKMRMTNHMRIIVQPYIFGLFVDHKVQSRWGKLGCRVYSKRRHYSIQCVEWCAVIGWADLSHSAEKGDWRLSRFGKKREKTWQNNTADIAFCIKFQIGFSISTRVNALDFLENKLFFLNGIYRVLEPNSSYINQLLFKTQRSIYIMLSVKIWISKSYSHCWKKFKYSKDAGKLKNLQDMEIFLKNSTQFNCSEQTRDSWTKITKQKAAVDHPGNRIQY